MALFFQLQKNKIILITICCTIFWVIFLPRVRLENTRGRYDLPQDTPTVQYYEAFKSLFGNRDLIFLCVVFDGIMDPDDIRVVEQLTRRISELPGIIAIQSLANAKRVRWEGAKITTAPLYRSENLDSLAATRLHRFIDTQPIYAGNLLSKDGQAAAFLIELTAPPSGQQVSVARQAGIVQNLHSVLTSLPASADTYYLAGLPLLSIAFQKNLSRDVFFFGLLSVLFIFIILFTLFKNWNTVLIISSIAALSLAWSLGLIGLTDTPLSIGLTILIPLIPAISIAYSLHYLHCFIQLKDSNEDANTKFDVLLKKIFYPSLLAGLTTAAGFLGLTISDLPGIREVGFYIGMGVLFTSTLNNLFLPALLYDRLSRKTSQSLHPFLSTRVPAALSRLVINHPGKIISVALAAGLIAVAGMLRLQLSTNQLMYFRENEPVRRDYLFIDHHFSGTLPLEIVVSATPNDVNALLPKMDALESGLREIEGLGHVISMADFLKMADRVKPSASALVRGYFDFKNGVFPDDLWKKLGETDLFRAYLHSENSQHTFRIACRAHVQGSEKLEALQHTVTSIVKQHLSGYPFYVTGSIPVLVSTQAYIMQSQINSFTFAFMVILLLLSLVARSWCMGFLIIAANVLPVVIILGVMGWLSVPLDITTIMIASIAIGMVVDDTIHFVYRFRQEKRGKAQAGSAIEHAFQVVASPLVMTSVVFCGGFWILIPSTFLPISYFGLMSGLIIVVALLSDLLLLPALLILTERFYDC